MDKLHNDVLIKLAIDLDLPDIIKWCSINKRFNKLTCENDIFWMNKFYNDYGKYPKNSDITWKEFYKYVTITEPNILLWKGVEENILSYVVVALKRGADIEHKKEIDQDLFTTPLSAASENGYLEIVKYLVEHGADIEFNENWPLWLSAAYGHLEVVKYLLENGADIHAQGDLALFDASYNGDLEVVKYLIKHGANVDGHTLRAASENGKLEMVKYLVDHGVDVRDQQGDSALISASLYGYLEVVKYLVRMGANVHAQNDQALRFARKNKQVAVIEYLESLP